MASRAAVALRAEQLKIAIVVASYFVISILLVFVNKVLLSPEYSIPAPMFVTWFQCVVTVGICWACGELGKSARPGTFFAQFPVFQYKLESAKRLLPMSAIFVAMIVFNNLSLKYVEVSFYNVARSLTIVFNVLLTYFMLGQSTSVPTLVNLGIVVAGFFVGAKGEVRFSLLGTAFGVTSSLFVALNGIYTKKAMALVDGNEWRLSGYNNMNACIMFLPLILLTGEIDIITKSSALLFSPLFWIIMVMGGVFGFLIGIVTILQIKVTSPLTHNISGTAKACVQTVLALFIWRNPTTVANMSGVAMVLAGSMGYSYVRNKEMEAAKAAQQAAGASAPSTPAPSAPEAGADSEEAPAIDIAIASAHMHGHALAETPKDEEAEIDGDADMERVPLTSSAAEGKQGKAT